MLREPFISDNPFRLLDLASSEGYGALRRKADAVLRSAQVGLAPEVPLAEIFGEEIEPVPSRVRGLATDPVTLSLYRIFWPLNAHGVAWLSEGEGRLQDEFLRAWYGFVQSRSAHDLEQAIEKLARLINAGEFSQQLLEALAQDEGVPSESIIRVAFDHAIRHVATRSMAIAAEEWEEGRSKKARAMIDAVQALDISEADGEEVVRPFLALGDRVMMELDHETRGMADLIPALSTELSGRHDDLSFLAHAVGRHPTALVWEEASVQHRSALAYHLRERGLVLANDRDDPEAALAFIQRALALKPAPRLKEMLEEDLGTLQTILSRPGVRSAWKELTPCKAPGLATVNGIGQKLYGWGKFAGDETLTVSTLYFTVAFLPIFPLRRYVVSREGDAYRFYGQLPWSKWMKVHLGVALAIIVAGLIYLSNGPNSSPGYQPTESSYDSEASGGTYSNANAEPELASLATPLEEKKAGVDLEITLLNDKANALKDQVASKRAALRKFADRINAMHLDRTSDASVAAYNRKVAEYDRDRAAVNRAVAEHNEVIKLLKNSYRRQTELERKLSERVP